MCNKSSFLLPLIVLFSLSLVACTSKATDLPQTEQNTIATIVVATVEAAFDATQHALSETQRYTEITSTPQPTPSEAPINTVIPSIQTSPTPSTPAGHALRVAYTKAGNVYLWIEGSGSVGLTSSHDAVELRISGDGELIVFKRLDPNNYNIQELWVVNTSGMANERVLVSSMDLSELMPSDPSLNISGIGVLDFTWRPNTHEVAYNTLVLHEGPGFGPNHDLRLVNADTLIKTTLIETGQGGLFYYSPDGSQITLSNPESISLVKADGSDPQPNVLTFPDVITYSEYEYHPHPIWASDSSSLRVAIPPHDPLADPMPATRLWLIPVDGSPAVLLGNIQAMPFAWPDNAFSPNLERVIYAAHVGEPSDNQRELRIANPDGSNETIYASGESLIFTSWSPDSQHFIYEINSGANEGVYVGGINDQPVLITPDPHSMSDIHWLDGTRFAYLLSTNNLWVLRISNLNGEDLGIIDTLPDSNPKFDVLP